MSWVAYNPFISGNTASAVSLLERSELSFRMQAGEYKACLLGSDENRGNKVSLGVMLF